MGTKERQDRERQAVTASILERRARPLHRRRLSERLHPQDRRAHRIQPRRDLQLLRQQGRHLPRARRGRLSSPRRQGARGDDDRRSARERARAAGGRSTSSRKEQPAYFQLMFVDRSVPRITQQWEGFEFLQQMLDQRGHARSRRRSTPARSRPRSAPTPRCTCCGPSLIGPAVVGIRHRLATGEDHDALARDVLNATIAGLQAGVATTFVSCKCPEEGIAGAPVPAGVRSHES